MRVTLFVLSSISAITTIVASTLPIPESEEVPPIINPIVEPIVGSILESNIGPVIEPGVEPAVDPVIEPIIESIIEPDNEQTVDPIIEPAIDPIIEPVIEPIVESIVEPNIEPTVDTIIEPVVDPVIDPIVEPIIESAVESAVELVIESVIEPAIEPVVDPIVEPAVDPIVESSIKLAAEPVIDPIDEPAIEPVIAPIVDPLVEPIIEPTVETIVEPVIDPIVDQIPIPEPPSRSSTGVIPEDLKNAMQGIQSLASDVMLQANNIAGDGVKVQIIGNTYLRCQDMVDEIQEISRTISRPPTMLFSWEDQGGICSAFDSFGINLSKLITVLSLEPKSVVRDGFGDRFKDCFDELRPVLGLFIKQLIIYTPTCEGEMLRRIDQLDVALSNAKMRMEAARQS
ncbi:hypothetical protein NXS19_009513 [Fusarium pseudograminearum]|uniref:Uncharacterized protein n=1 Tax=Fusarium pseudograminearum (strain CS3096) TaxID=1028729 RepID=K3VNM6_FUSPC|nr:hypothetical protein FPSE_04507 [Fusarium pseudograminearum CS3096]EKJ75318.1 hypothetical protein FPSE_04507 [Fusarium pseudograminearum CS3096]KAF0638816.1 hypothetical protein FPSE5266_04507 [Fusarium pseudograminearum]UZP41697.1 hypothetical protein NXS19_009513 [Fusarium pseudograminearum]